MIPGKLLHCHQEKEQSTPSGCTKSSKSSGEIDRFKARLKAKGCNQMQGIDYHESFSHVAGFITIKTFLAIAAVRNWPIHQIDVNNVYLHGHLDDE